MRCLKLVQYNSELNLVSGLNWLWRHVIPTIENIHWSCCIDAAIPTQKVVELFVSQPVERVRESCSSSGVPAIFEERRRFSFVIATFAGDQVLRDCPRVSSEEDSLMESLQSRLCLTLRAATYCAFVTLVVDSVLVQFRRSRGAE